MLNNTRSAIRPFTSSGNPITPDIMTKIMTIWISLASALEDAMKLQEGEILVWCLSLSGGEDAKPSMGQTKAEPPRAHAQVELCKAAQLPFGCYAIHSATSTFQGTLVSLSSMEINILADGLRTKFTGPENQDKVVSEMVRQLRK